MKSRENEVAPSILAADFSRLADEIRLVEKYSDRLHIDVMDGHFVPNLSLGPVVVSSLRPVTKLPLEVHLMVEHPDDFVDAFIEAGADRLIFHAEVSGDARALIGSIKEKGCSAGLALNPETPFMGVELGVEEGLDELDLLLCMTVNPGFGGQGFLEEVLPKIEEASRALTARGLSVDIEVDGGINPVTAARAKEAGANVFVAGNSIFRDKDPAEAARALAESVGRQSS